LATIYVADLKDYSRGLEMVRRLRTVYPQSSYFQFLEALCLWRLGDFNGSYGELRGLLQRARSDPDILGRKQLSLICGLTGASCLAEEDVREADAWLTRALGEATARGNGPSERDWRGFLLLYRGVARDLQGRRAEALADFEGALSETARPDNPGHGSAAVPNPAAARVADLARHCRSRACDRAEAMRLLKAYSLERPADLSHH
jgi:tetratricopeptide (TPR) repeat protein